MLKSDLCSNSDAYITVTRKIIAAVPINNVYDKKLGLKNNVPFI